MWKTVQQKSSMTKSKVFGGKSMLKASGWPTTSAGSAHLMNTDEYTMKPQESDTTDAAGQHHKGNMEDVVCILHTHTIQDILLTVAK